MNTSPESVGRFVGFLLFGSPAVFFLVHGLKGRPRSRRLANLALFCGLTAFVVPEAILGLSFTDRPWLLRASGVVRVLLGIVGVALAVAALFARRDGGVGVARPVAGVGFSLLHLSVGVGALMLSSYTQPSVPWVYQAPGGEFRITLPSSQWEQSSETGEAGGVRFVRRFPRTQANVLTVFRDQTEGDFRRVIEAFRERVAGNPGIRGQPKFRDGTNGGGHRYHYCTAVETGPNGELLFIAYSVTWCEQKRMVIRVIFEGVSAMHSRTGQDAEMGAFEKDAEAICLSVE